MMTSDDGYRKSAAAAVVWMFIKAFCRLTSRCKNCQLLQAPHYRAVASHKGSA
jgi:hypothetical protein